ncbi:MAG: hypothetical protein ACR2G4_14170 [Pyrinomonadaceae bacterium]
MIEMKDKQMAFSLRRLITICLLASACGTAAVAVTASPVVVASGEAEARGAIEQAFQQLKAGDYNSLYEVLPTASQRRLARDQFVRALERARGMYELERLEIGAVRVSGDLGVVDSTIYGRALAPLAGEGKIVLRQYLVREGGRWRVTTGDRATIQPLLTANPTFAKKYPLTQPRLYLKRDGRWMDISRQLQNMRRRTTK